MVSSIPATVTSVTDKVKNAVNSVPEPVKETAKAVGEAAKDVAVDAAHAKAAEKLDHADKVVNNPLTKIVAGMISPDVKKTVEDAGAKIKESQKDP